MKFSVHTGWHRSQTENSLLISGPHMSSWCPSFLCPDPPQNAVEEAMDMYQELHRWDECIAVAQAKV